VQQRVGFILYHIKRQFAEGLQHTREAVRLDPSYGFAQCDLGVALLHQNQPAQAIPCLVVAVEKMPRNREAQYQSEAVRLQLAKAYLQTAAFADAAAQLEQSVQAGPDNAEAQYLLALSLACTGKIDGVLDHYSKAVALSPAIDTSPSLHEALGENYARSGRFAEAIASAEQALKLAEASGKRQVAERVRGRLERYRQALSASVVSGTPPQGQ
jgi:tetratricopeptide (TPR) repeat protein